MKTEELDQNMRLVKPESEDGICWYTPTDAPFLVEGFAFYQQEHRYCRLPCELLPKLRNMGRPAVADLGWHTAGGQIRFRSNTGRLYVRAVLNSRCDMHNMTILGQGGFDCYLRREGAADYVFAGVGRFAVGESEYTSTLWQGGDCEWKEWIINFPLYMGVKKVEIGLEEPALVLPAKEHGNPPVAIYGTSIDQGGCASRPGMCPSNQISRSEDRTVYNFGFSGNGWADQILAPVIAGIPGLSLLIVNVEANAGPLGMLDHLYPFLEAVHGTAPALPVLVLSAPLGSLEAYAPNYVRQKDLWREQQREAVETCRRQGWEQFRFMDGRLLWPGGGDDYIVDDVHPTDLGFYMMVQNLIPVIRQLAV